jgi:hypothetical protein
LLLLTTFSVRTAGAKVFDQILNSINAPSIFHRICELKHLQACCSSKINHTHSQHELEVVFSHQILLDVVHTYRPGLIQGKFRMVFGYNSVVFSFRPKAPTIFFSFKVEPQLNGNNKKCLKIRLNRLKWVFFAYLEARTCGAITGKVRSLEVNFDH